MWRSAPHLPFWALVCFNASSDRYILLISTIRNTFLIFMGNISLGTSQKNVCHDTVFTITLKYCYVVLTE
jgi:hypothetical protein